MPYTNINGIRIYYEETGTGFPLLILLPLGCVISHLKDWIHSFSDKFRVIIADPRGGGQSQVTPGPYTIKLLAEDAAALLDYMHINKAHVIGTSLGGHIAQELAILRPELVDRLVLVLSAARSDQRTRERLKLWRELKAVWNDEMFAREVCLWVNSNRFYENKKEYHDWINAFVKSMDYSREGYIALIDAAISFDSLERVKNIKSRTICFCGKEDICFNRAQVHEMADAIHGARFEMLDCAHVLIGNCYDKFVEITREFLASP
jgi:3-oxoadipate enol-lactonase